MRRCGTRACPSSTPFRRSADLKTGIDLPDYSLRELRERVVHTAASLGGPRRILVFACETGGAAGQPDGIVTMPCVAMMPPSLVDFALSEGLADGVMVAGCAESACYNRLGVAWTKQRFAGERDPYLRARVPRERLRTVWASVLEARKFQADGSRHPSAGRAAGAAGANAATRHRSRRRRDPAQECVAVRMLRTGLQFAVILALFSGVAALADWPAYRQIPEGTGVITMTFVHGANRKIDCRRRTPEEIAKLPPNMRRPDDCPRGRRPLYVELDIGGRTAYAAVLKPTGIAGDGPSRVYERFVLPAGSYDIAVRMRDSPRKEGFDHERRERVALAASQNLVIDFRSETGEFVFR